MNSIAIVNATEESFVNFEAEVPRESGIDDPIPNLMLPEGGDGLSGLALASLHCKCLIGDLRQPSQEAAALSYSKMHFPEQERTRPSTTRYQTVTSFLLQSQSPELQGLLKHLTNRRAWSHFLELASHFHLIPVIGNARVCLCWQLDIAHRCS